MFKNKEKKYVVKNETNLDAMDARDDSADHKVGMKRIWRMTTDFFPFNVVGYTDETEKTDSNRGECRTVAALAAKYG